MSEASNEPTTAGEREESLPQDEAEQQENKTENRAQGDALAKALALLALLIALLSAGGGYWLWQMGTQQHSANQSQFAAVDAHVADMRAQLAARLDQLDRQQAQAALANADLQKSLASLHEEIGRDRGAWAVAETIYFLQLANARLQLLQDVDTALQALSLADNRLEALGDPGFIPVREKIRVEIAALEAVATVDITGTALTLGALASQVPELPLHAPAKHAQEQVDQASETAQAQEPGWREELGRIWDVMRELVEVRRTDKRIEPLLKPDEHRQLVQNLQLQLQTARIAALQRDGTLYRDSLATATGWLQTYYDMDAEATRSVVEQLNRLTTLDLSPALPDISASLRLLRNMSDNKARKAAQ